MRTKTIFLSALFSTIGFGVLPTDGFAAGVVTNFTDASLRAALAGGGYVCFAGSGTIALTNSIPMTANTVLDGTGQTVILSGNASVPIFSVPTNVNFTLSNLTLANGLQNTILNGGFGNNAFGGGAISNGGCVLAVGCQFTNNAAQFLIDFGEGFCGGGAVLNLGTFVASNCVFCGSQASCGLASIAGSESHGGAIYSSGNLAVANCGFTNNSASGGVGFERSAGGAGRGGAIYNSGTFSASSSTFVANNSGGGAGGSGGNGYGGAINSGGGSTSVMNCVFSNNSAGGGQSASDSYGQPSDGSGSGGAICCTGGSLLASNIVIVRNHANGASLASASPFYAVGGSGQGGGLYLASPAWITNGLISNNIAGGGQGGGYASGPAQGGGVFNSSAALFSGCNFVSNQAAGANAQLYYGPGSTGGSAYGGAFFNNGALELQNCALAGNTATGGAPANWGFSMEPGGNGEGGAIANSGTMMVFGTTLSNNLASGTAPVGFTIYNTSGFQVDTNVTLFASVTASPPLAYQWLWNGSPIGGATNSSLNLTNTPFSATGSNDLVISNATSLIADLDEIWNAPVLAAPSFVLQPPQGMTVASNTTVVLQAMALGCPAPAYQWFYNSTNLPGSTNSCLILPNVQPGQSGTYSVSASNSINSVASQPTVLVVVGCPSVTNTFTDSSGAFDIQFSGSSGTHYSVWGSSDLLLWTWLGTATESSPGCFQFSDIGATNCLSRFYQVCWP